MPAHGARGYRLVSLQGCQLVDMAGGMPSIAPPWSILDHCHQRLLVLLGSRKGGAFKASWKDKRKSVTWDDSFMTD